MTTPPTHRSRRRGPWSRARARAAARPALLATACCALLALPAPRARAQTASGYDFLLDEPSAQSAGLAGAAVAAAGQPDALRYNPAGLAGIAGLAAAVAEASAAGDWNEGWGSLAAEWGPVAVGGEALISNIAPFTLYDADGNPIGTATAGNQNIGLGAAYGPTPWLRFGADARWFRSQLYTYSSQGGALDLGAQAGRPDGPLSAGIAVQNLGAAGAYISQQEPLPLLARVGLRGRFTATPGLDLSPEVDVIGYQDPTRPTEVRLGVEAAVERWVFLRTGWTQSADFSGPSLGLGVRWRIFTLDYAYGSDGLLGSNQTVELRAEDP